MRAPPDPPPPPTTSTTPLRGEGLLGAVRFPLMDGAYLARAARGRLASESLDGLVLEACAVKHVPPEEQSALALRYLRRSALVPRALPPPAQPQVRIRSHERRQPARPRAAERAVAMP